VQAIRHKSSIIASIDTLFPREVFLAPSKLHPSSTRESPHPASRTHDYFILFMPLARGESALTSASVAGRNRREYLELLSNAPFPGNPLAPAGFAGREDARERIDCTKGRDFLQGIPPGKERGEYACTPDTYFTILAPACILIFGSGDLGGVKNAPWYHRRYLMPLEDASCRERSEKKSVPFIGARVFPFSCRSRDSMLTIPHAVSCLSQDPTQYKYERASLLVSLGRD